jgi:hypothetical protein
MLRTSSGGMLVALSMRNWDSIHLARGTMRLRKLSVLCIYKFRGLSTFLSFSVELLHKSY